MGKPDSKENVARAVRYGDSVANGGAEAAHLRNLRAVLKDG